MQRARAVAMAAAILVLAVAPIPALAAAPSNDEPATATVITSLPFSTSVDLTEATNEDPGYPVCESFSHNRVWFAYTPPSSGTMEASIGNAFPEVELVLWTVGSGATDLTLSKCAIGGLSLVAELTAGTTYLISIGMWDFGTPFAGTLMVRDVAPPANDNVANATEITGASFTDTSISRAAGLASTFEPGETASSCPLAEWGIVPPNSFWYRLVAPADVTLHIQTAGLAWVGVYHGSTYPGASEVACVIEGDLFVELTAGEAYLVQVGPNRNGDNVLTATMTIPPAHDAFDDPATISTTPFSDEVDLTNATTQGFEPGGCGYGGSHTVWYSFTASTNVSLVPSASQYDGWWRSTRARASTSWTSSRASRATAAASFRRRPGPPTGSRSVARSRAA